LTVVDVNSPQSWAEAHVPGALNLDPAGYRESDLPHCRQKVEPEPRTPESPLPSCALSDKIREEQGAHGR
jgi:rhodanese-related sulfurtransferase